MKIRFINFALLFISVLFIIPVYAQPLRSFKQFDNNENTYNIHVSDGIYKVEILSSKIVHTSFLPNAINTKDYSFAAIMEPQKTAIEVEESEKELIISTKGIAVLVTKEPFNIRYLYKGNDLLAENKGYFADDSLQYMSLGLNKEEVLYGAGARVLGMDRRGYKLNLYNRAHYGYETHSELMNYSMPMYISSNKYAVLFDNASIGHLDLDSEKNNSVIYETVSGTVNYYLIAGDDWFDLTTQNTALTGRQPLPPRWAFGGFSSRFGYHSQSETEAMVNKFIEDSIPLDAIIIDIYWFGKDVQGHMGNLDWDRDSFPNPEKMMQDFADKGVKTILVTEPFILTTCKRWGEAVHEQVLGTDSLGDPYTYDFFFGNTGLVDVFKTKAADWFWNIYKERTLEGVGGWWGDLGEPEVHPSTLQHINGSADEVHNAYGHEWARLVYEGYTKDFPNKRPFILMRSGFTGSQRYGMIPWTGDVSRTWGGLVPQTEISLQMGMQGMAYMHSDLGGFAGDHALDEALYVRWLQYGVFQPIYRPHAQEAVNIEIAHQSGKTKELAIKALKLRYKLLPYIYNIAYENSSTGKPLMIPLFYIEPNNKSLLTYDDAYLWGDAFLVAPIKAPNVTKQNVYLPATANWIDFYTDKLYQGGQSIPVEVRAEYIPTFVKSGSFVPMQKQIKSASEYNLSDFEVHYYDDSSVNAARYTLYNDDGESKLNIESETYTFTMNKADKAAGFTITQEGNIYNTKGLTFDLYLHNTPQPKRVIMNGKKLNKSAFSYSDSKKLLIRVESAIKNVEIQVQF